ncbi:MAG: hypothetical protein WAZ14_00965 [Patescibacteria group bacterium]
MRINFVFGQVVSFESLAENTVALDGAVQGPKLDPKTRRYSFDHHADCIRLITLATCQQVFAAIFLGGLIVDNETTVVINELDADTILSVWLLKNPGRVNEPAVKELVDRVGYTDSHGPAFAPHWLHFQLSSWKKEDQTMAFLEKCLGLIDQFFAGELKEPAARPTRESIGFGWHPLKGWAEVQTQNGFGDLYKSGFLAGFLAEPQADGTVTYTVAKKSDLVDLPVGPSHVDRNADPASYRSDTVLGSLALLELEANPSQAHKANWGGGSSVGGSCRNEDKSASRLTPEQVLEVFKRFTK